MNDDILWWSTAEWQAVGTIVLVLVTIVYVAYTAILSGHAKKSATSAEESARAAERAATIAERGLLLQTMPLVFGHKVEMTGSGRWQVTLFSRGGAPAFNVLAVARQGDVEGDTGVLSDHDPDDGPRELDLSQGFGLNDIDPYEVEVTYYDAIGHGYRTRRMSLLGGQSETHVDRYDDEAEEWVPLI